MRLFPAAVSLLGLVLFAMPGYSQASKPAPKCVPIFEIDTEMYPGTPDTKVDKVKVCEDGMLVAFHVFTAPAFRNTAAERTRWEYAGRLDKNSLAGLRQFLLRTDVVNMPERQDVPLSPNRGSMQTLHASVYRDGKDQTITIEKFPLLSCDETPEELSQTEHDLICVFGELYQQASTGKQPDADCGCQTLRGMASGR